MRRRHSLGGTNGLGKDALPQLPFHGVAHDQVDLGAEDLLDPALDAEEVEEADGLVELDEQVDVAVRARLSASDRAKQVDRAYAQPGELGSRSGKALKDLVAGHMGIPGPAAGRDRPATEMHKVGT
jgi:hypothetical protein